MKMKIASYNIHKAVGFDRRRSPERILSVVNALSADVVVLQEADMRLGARPTVLPRFLIEQETDFAIADVAETDVSLGWHGNAVLVRRGLKIGSVDRIELPGLEPRGAVAVQIEGLTLIGTHLGLIRRWRQLQMAAIRNWLGDHAGRALVIGDFNEWSTRSGFEPWHGHLTVRAPARSFPAIRPIAMLDRFAHGPQVRILDTGIETRRPAHIASDHLPLWVVVKVT
ncbi:endonuclease/exonuclease/phosphatase family protein [Seohaeicola nanhaiensis]|uniref:Endonuclease/exonuclease/phosphatase family protein n=1 Tax=Seohaeicola nanhaiensis TaxID=1387282 RepID=A0ABV9KK85_9RHOB